VPLGLPAIANATGLLRNATAANEGRGLEMSPKMSRALALFLLIFEGKFKRLQGMIQSSCPVPLGRGELPRAFRPGIRNVPKNVKGFSPFFIDF